MNNVSQKVMNECIESFMKKYLKLDPMNKLMFGAHIEKHIKEQFKNLAYPEAREWEYCIPIMSNVTIDGDVVDLGFVLQDNGRVSACIVHSNESGDYSSGDCFWASSNKYKKLALELLHWNILDEEILKDQFTNHNNLWKKFYKSDVTIWELSDLLTKK